MVKKKVLHFVRKNTQLKASFIYNQIANQQIFEPLIAFRIKNDNEYNGGFADIDLQKNKYLDLSQNEDNWDKLLFKSIKYLSKKHERKILDFIDQEKIDVCHFHYGTDCGIYYPLLKQLKIPSIVSFYGYDCSSFPKYMHGFGRKYLRERVFDDISVVLAMSPDMKKDLIAAGCVEEKIIVHYHGADCGRFYHQHAYQVNEKVNLLVLASLVPQKGHLFLLKSLNQLVIKGFNKFHLRIIGTGEMELELKRFVKTKVLSDYVTFVGPLKYASTEMMNEYKNADIFIHPSVIAKNNDKEGIPGTLVEAMSSGIPIISTYHAGIPYIIENNKTGILVKEWDIEELEKEIVNLIEDKDLRERIGKAGQQFAIKNLDLILKEKELEEIYIKIVENYKNIKIN